jgi:alpha-glucosidase
MSSASQPWWRHAAVYQLYVRSFADADGDGIGDLRGIRERMPYVASLGVDAIWLNPCFPSPQRDHGYDVSNYFDIEPAYGDLAEFDRLIETASAHSISILMDVVPNHCSSDHPWFQAALAAAPGSPERDRFTFLPGKGAHGELPPNDWKAIFGGSAWTRTTNADGTPGEWYLAVFTPHQPDLNWDNADVVEHFDDMLRFWFDRGVEGFRADAVLFNAKAPGFPDLGRELEISEFNPLFTWRPEGHRAWQHWRTVVDQYNQEHPGRDVYLVAEAYTPLRPELLLQYSNDNEFHQAFAFDLMLAPWRPKEWRDVIDETVRVLGAAGQVPAWTLNNHDAQRSVTRYGRKDAVTRGFQAGAITNDDAPVDVALGETRARAAVLVVMALPGCVYLYAGEELGLPEVLDLPDSARQDPVFFNTGGVTRGRDGCRIPLPWTADGAGSNGFSPATSTSAPWLPLPDYWSRYSIDSQERDAASFLSLYRSAGGIRKLSADLRSDAFDWVDGEHADLILFRRGNITVAANLTASPVALRTTPGTVLLTSSWDHHDSHVVPANTTVWFS